LIERKKSLEFSMGRNFSKRREISHSKKVPIGTYGNSSQNKEENAS
jgi:hypothetical protein